MAGEIQEPLNLSLLENSIHSGSISFGRFEKEVLSWEKRSSFSHNRYLEEAEKFSKPGSVTQMRAHFEAHFKKKGIHFPSTRESQTWGGLAQQHHHQQTASENLWESMSQCSNYSYEQDKYYKEKSESCVSYESYDDCSSVSVVLEKTNIGCIERSLEDKVKKTFSSASSKKHVAITKSSSSCNTKTSFETRRGKERIVESLASQSSTTKKTENQTPIATNKFRSKKCISSAMKDRTTSNGFSLRSNERVEKRKEENVEAIVRKSLNSKARPMPKSTQARPQRTSTCQQKARRVVQEHSSKASCDRSLACGAAKSKLNINKQKVDTYSSDQTAKNKANIRSLAVRRSAVEVVL